MAEFRNSGCWGGKHTINFVNKLSLKQISALNLGLMMSAAQSMIDPQKRSSASEVQDLEKDILASVQNFLNFLQRKVRFQEMSKQGFYNLSLVTSNVIKRVYVQLNILLKQNSSDVHQQNNQALKAQSVKLILKHVLLEFQSILANGVQKIDASNNFGRIIKELVKIVQSLQKNNANNYNSEMQEQSEQLCQICCFPLQSLNHKQKFERKQCGHRFHIKCLQTYCEWKINNNEMTRLRCPHQKCLSSLISLQELHTIFKNKNAKEKNLTFSAKEISMVENETTQSKSTGILQKFYDFSFDNYLLPRRLKIQDFTLTKQKQKCEEEDIEKYFYCLTPSCNAVYCLNKTQSYQKNLLCLSCKKIYCMSCYKPFHNKMTCEANVINNQYTKQDHMFDEYLKQKGKKYKKCPNCNFWVDNWRGCSTIKCRCGIQFCYKCGNVGCPHAKCLNIPPPT